MPNNDVTLWDQSYVAAALFKSAVAGALLDSRFPWGQRIKQIIRWRLLTVAIGADHYEARAVKIGDWTGMQGALEEFFARVSELVEVDLAAGSLLYQDSSTLVFSFPGERFDEGVPANWVDEFKQWIEGEIDRIAQDLDFETPPLVRLRSSPTRSLVPLVQERREAQRAIAIPIHKRWNICWRMPDESKGHVCPVCQMRLNGDPTNKGKPCQVCWDRRHHRRDDWLSGYLGYDTIWFEEVADHNDRIALLTFALDLEPWLNGERVDSLRAQAIPEWRRFNPVLFGIPNPVDPAQPFESLRSYIHSKLAHLDPKDPVLKSLQEGYQHERDWPTFFQKIVEDRAEAPSWDELNDDQRASWLVHQLFRKLPSPGRVYRFWREAQEFFEDLLKEFRQISARSENPWRVRRLLIQPQSGTGGSPTWRDGTRYEGRWMGLPFSLLYVRALDGFVTASNLARLLKAEEGNTVLQGAHILLAEEDTFGSSQQLVVARAKEIEAQYSHLSVYHPVIPLELSPLRFRVIVPLEAASECVDLTRSRWKEAFARVWDRLPLHIGIVAFDRKLPFQAVIEAVRHLEARLACSREERWAVVQTERCPEAKAVALALRRPDGQTTVRLVPVTMPDGREDVFYPYARIEDRQLRDPLDLRHPDGTMYRHVKDLHLGDGITVIPARVGFLFMETAGARFEEANLLYAEDWEEMREIWKLVVRTAPSQTALQRFRSDLPRLEQDWQATLHQASSDLWRDTVRALIASHLEVKGAALETLTDAASRGLLQRALDWHTTVLKMTIRGG